MSFYQMSKILGTWKLLTIASRSVVSSSNHLPPLAAAFNKKKFPKIISLGGKKTGLFQIPELTRAEGFGYLKEACVRKSIELVNEAINPNRSRLVTAIFDDLSDELCKVADMAEFVRLSHPSADVAAAAEDACIAISGLVEELNTQVDLYQSLRQVVENGDDYPETEVDRHVAKLFLHDFEQCGIHLDNASRDLVVKLNDRILQVGQQFAAATQKPSKMNRTRIPENIASYFSQDNEGNVVIHGLHVESPNESLREAAYRIFYLHNEQQDALLQELLTNRHKLAQLCGYPTFGHRAMKESVGSRPENVHKFLNRLSTEVKIRVKDEYSAILNMKKHLNPMAKQLQVWDMPYFTTRARNTWIDVNCDRVSEYFSLGVCMEGLNTIFKRLFNVELVMDNTDEGELWHNEIYKLAVNDLKDGSVLGHIYCDFFPRDGKPYQDCHFTIRGGRQLSNGSYQNPVVVLMLNLPRPGWDEPSLLSGPLVDNLFHEMGHAMHSMLGRTKYQHVTGTRCSTDFAEVPSTLMEYFAADPKVLTEIGRHYETGESLPPDVAHKFCASKKVFSAVDVQTQLFYALVDQKFHSHHPLGCSSTEMLKRLHEEHHSLPFHDGTAWHLRFAHLVGYGARYYSYLMARSVASSIWQRYFQNDPLNPDAGAKYRQECLSHGGGKPSLKLVSDFLGLQAEPEVLADALISELDCKKDIVKSVLKN